MRYPKPDLGRRLTSNAVHPECGQETDDAVGYAGASHRQGIIFCRRRIGDPIKTSRHSFDEAATDQRRKLVACQANVKELGWTKESAETGCAQAIGGVLHRRGLTRKVGI